MCGIVGYIGYESAEPILLDGLTRLEYRGYDSAGIATLNAGTHIRRAPGKIAALKSLVASNPLSGCIGIGHVRWATHGKPTEANAHPHHFNGITIVHNGIIENHQELQDGLQKSGHKFLSETDSEIIAHLIANDRAQGASLLEAVSKTITKLKGAFALAVLDETIPDSIVCAKLAAPLLIGTGNCAMHIASDLAALLNLTSKYVALDDGDIAVVNADSVKIIGRDGKSKVLPQNTLDWSPQMTEKNGHKHFMHKEIFEQPKAITETTVSGWSHVNRKKLEHIDRIMIVACGSSLHAGMIGRNFIEKYAGIPVELDIASEFRYRNPVLSPRTLVMGISQSGETADTISAMKKAADEGAMLLAICNVVDSQMSRLCSDYAGTIYTRAGIEIGVASTKGFMAQLVSLKMLALYLGEMRSVISNAVRETEINAINTLPGIIENILESENSMRTLAQKYKAARSMLFVGRGVFFPLALEGALKMKELSYIHAEGYAAGEMKHGPLALIDSEMPICVLAFKGQTYEKTLSNLEQAKARGGKILGFCEEGDERISQLCDDTIYLPAVAESLQPFVATLPLQLFAYHVADLKGLDVDQPRNLAKSVTVE